MVEFQNVSKVYNNGTKALKNINLNIKKGEFVFIVGSSGAGKSTFLKLIMCEEKPNEGKIIIDGTDVTKIRKSKIPFMRRRMGIVFQDFRLIDHMNVYDNIAFAMRVVGASGKAIKKRIPYILSLVGLQNKAKNRPNELSGGERQRVGLARALVNNPTLIIADEPTGNIDPALSFEIVDLLSEINRCGTTVLMVTHEHSLVKHFHKRIIQIHGGEIVADTVARSAKEVSRKEAQAAYEKEQKAKGKKSSDKKRTGEKKKRKIEHFTDVEQNLSDDDLLDAIVENVQTTKKEKVSPKIEDNSFTDIPSGFSEDITDIYTEEANETTFENTDYSESYEIEDYEIEEFEYEEEDK